MIKTFKLSPEIESRLSQISQEMGLTEDELIEKAIINYLEELEEIKEAQEELSLRPPTDSFLEDIKNQKVTIYTDGACLGNPGKGGYGVVLRYGKHCKELSGGFKRTTNNRMEILAAIKALEALKYPCKVTLHTDSRYLVDAMTKNWAKRWQANDWMRNKKESAKNPDLWKILLQLCEKHEVEFVWVKGHAGIADNERCDQLAVAAAQQKNLPSDEGYEG